MKAHPQLSRLVGSLDVLRAHAAWSTKWGRKRINGPCSHDCQCPAEDCCLIACRYAVIAVIQYMQALSQLRTLSPPAPDPPPTPHFILLVDSTHITRDELSRLGKEFSPNDVPVLVSAAAGCMWLRSAPLMTYALCSLAL